jgi:DNA-binding transcriptional MocR family regulator
MAMGARSDYERWLDQGLALDLTRGKPSPEQLALSDGLLAMLADGRFVTGGGDVRNYGGDPAGLLELRTIFAPLLQVPADQLCAGGNSSLTLMYLAMMTSFFDSPQRGMTAWRDLKPTFLCPVPGYDRHFQACADLGITMVAVPMTSQGPDMNVVETLAAGDPSVKGIWCVPKYSNPTGCTYTSEVIDRLARMSTAADDFRIYWDNAYAVHHLTDTPDVMANILRACETAGNPDRAFVFGSTSKITFASAGVSFFGSSPANIEWWLRHATKRTVGPNQLNQLLHARFFGNPEGVTQHMRRHRTIMEPKFAGVQRVLQSRLSGLSGVSWTVPRGGYFVSLQAPPGTAKRVVELAAKAGVKLTPAGAPFPYGDDPHDSNIRIAPTFPALDDVELAVEVLADCIILAAQDAA